MNLFRSSSLVIRDSVLSSNRPCFDLQQSHRVKKFICSRSCKWPMLSFILCSVLALLACFRLGMSLSLVRIEDAKSSSLYLKDLGFSSFLFGFFKNIRLPRWLLRANALMRAKIRLPTMKSASSRPPKSPAHSSIP